MADRQRTRLYEYEDQWNEWNRQNLSLKGLRKIVRWACRQYHVSMPKVTQHRSKMWSVYSPDSKWISFNKRQSNAAIALHEAAHHILYELTGERYEDHGREWLGIYLYLLIERKEAPPIALTASAKAAGLKWIPLDDAAPMRFRQRSKKSSCSDV